MSRSKLHDWECTIERICGDKANEMFEIAQDIYNTAYVRGKNAKEWEILEQESQTNIALERYKDLQDYFGDEDIAKVILENQTEFKAWLERLRWNTTKVDELARKLDTLEKESETDIDKIRSGIEQAFCEPENDFDLKRNYGLYMALEIIDKYRNEE